MFKKSDYRASFKSLNLSLLGGVLFIIIKSVEYIDKIENGLTLSSSSFFTFYWLLTGFHFVHVLVGLVILLSFYRKLSKNPEEIDILDLEAGASFWHMCDLIWLILFPALYLVFL